MEPGIIIAVMVSCMVAVGAGVFTAIQGSKKTSEKKSDDDTANNE